MTAAWGDRARLLAVCQPIPRHDPLALLRLSPHVPRIYWGPPAPGTIYVGIGAAVKLAAVGAARFARLQLRISDLFADAVIAETDAISRAARPRLFGGFGFTAHPVSDGQWTAFPPALLIVPHYLYTETTDGAWLTVSQLTDTTRDPAAGLGVLREQAEAFLAAAADPPLVQPLPPVHAVQPLTDQLSWTDGVTTITSAIRAGTLQKAVLARAVDLTLAHLLEPVTPLARLIDRYPDTYRFLIQPGAGQAFFGASPELIAEVTGGHLSTAALAGSRPRGATPAADRALAAELLASPKEREEHTLVVDMLRRRIAPYADTLTIPDTPAIMPLKNIQHLYTPVTAALQSRYGVLDLVNELHPTPALGGWPSHAAQTVIAQLEPTERGWYAAPVGWVDESGDGMFAVAIRSAVSTGLTARLYAGAGIVADSDPAAEWRETAVKFTPLLDALGASGALPRSQGGRADERAQP